MDLDAEAGYELYCLYCRYIAFRVEPPPTNFGFGREVHHRTSLHQGKPSGLNLVVRLQMQDCCRDLEKIFFAFIYCICDIVGVPNAKNIIS